MTNSLKDDFEKRIFSAYEKNQLLKYNISLEKAEQLSEMPVEYITGFVEFCGNIFNVDKNTLIPRVETEELVEMIITDILENTYKKSPIVVADIGTGSGAIGLSITKKLLDKQVQVNTFLSDISKDALTVAEKNRDKLGIPKENTKCPLGIKFIESDLLDSFPKEIKLDIIVANLPYIPHSQMSKLDESVIDYEPSLALDGGENGLQLIDKLLNDIKNWIKPNAIIYLELDETHIELDIEKTLLNNFKEDDFTIDMYKDQFGRNRFSKISFFSIKGNEK